MSTELATDPTPQNAKSVSLHALAPLSKDEIQTAAAIMKASWPAHTDLYFKVITLQEPPKVEVLKYLEAEHSGQPLPSVHRKAFINYYIRNTVCTNLAISQFKTKSTYRANSMRLLLTSPPEE
jgi:primary-amine oxidase